MHMKKEVNPFSKYLALNLKKIRLKLFSSRNLTLKCNFTVTSQLFYFDLPSNLDFSNYVHNLDPILLN